MEAQGNANKCCIFIIKRNDKDNGNLKNENIFICSDTCNENYHLNFKFVKGHMCRGTSVFFLGGERMSRQSLNWVSESTTAREKKKGKK